MVGGGHIRPRPTSAIEASARAYAKRELDKVVTQARKAGVRATARVLEGSPHERIVRAARGLRADLIVMGTHGRQRLAVDDRGPVAAADPRLLGGGALGHGLDQEALRAGAG